MKSIVEQRLESIGITIPDAPVPAGNYIPYTVSQGMVYLSGQTTRVNGKYVVTGKAGRDLSLEEAKKGAQICAINLLSQLRMACDGDLDRVARCVRIGGFVACADEFTQISEVLNGASDIIIAAFAQNGRHARTAVGVSVLPSNSAVEVDAVFELKES